MKTLPFSIPNARKMYSFRAEPPRKGHLESIAPDFENTAVGKGSTLKTRV